MSNLHKVIVTKMLIFTESYTILEMDIQYRSLFLNRILILKPFLYKMFWLFDVLVKDTTSKE